MPNTMKVNNMTGLSGAKVKNQFLLSGFVLQLPSDTYEGDAFQSYETIIAFRAYSCGNTGNTSKIFLDEKYWDCSSTTSKYRNIFLNRTTAEIKAAIELGEILLVDLNGDS